MRMFNTTVGRLVLTACVAGLIAAAIGGVSLARAGGTNHGRTIRVTEVDNGGKFINITHTANGGPGDEFIFSANLRHAGHKVGTLDAMCTLMPIRSPARRRAAFTRSQSPRPDAGW